MNAGHEFQELLRTVRHSSWRWECQGDYQSDHAEVRRWLDGEPYTEDERFRGWVRYIESLRDAGIPFERVRMLTEPLTEYLEWMLATTHRNIAAGEDIRWIGPDLAHELGMPDYDFYIFDDDRVLILRFGKDRALTGADLTDDSDVVRNHQSLRDLVWQYAIPHHAFTRKP